MQVSPYEQKLRGNTFSIRKKKQTQMVTNQSINLLQVFRVKCSPIWCDWNTRGNQNQPSVLLKLSDNQPSRLIWNHRRWLVHWYPTAVTDWCTDSRFYFKNPHMHAILRGTLHPQGVHLCRRRKWNDENDRCGGGARGCSQCRCCFLEVALAAVI